MASIFWRNPKNRTEEPGHTAFEAELTAENSIREEQDPSADAGNGSPGVFDVPFEEYVATKIATLGDPEDDFRRFTTELQITRETLAGSAQKREETVHEKTTFLAELKSAWRQKCQARTAASDTSEDAEEETRLDRFIDGIFAFVRSKCACAAKILKQNSCKLIKGWEQKFTPAREAGLARAEACNEKAADLVQRFDLWLDALCEQRDRLLVVISCKWDAFKNKAEENKKKILLGAAGAAACCAAVTMIMGSITAYEYSYHGKLLGVVEDPQDVLKTVKIIGNNLDYVYGAQVRIDPEKDITFKQVRGLNQNIDNKEDILNTLTYMRDMQVTGYGLYIGGERMALLQSREAVDRLLETIKQNYLVEAEGREYLKVGFAEEVSIKELSTRMGNLDDEEQALEFLATGGIQETVYQVVSGDTFSEIASRWGISQSELLAFNPDVVPEKLHIGQELVMSGVAPLLTVQTTEIAVYNENIQYEIEYEDTSSLYIGETTVKKSGVLGQRQVTAEIVRNNGVEISREELESVILSEPSSQIVLTGTKEPPPLIGTGTFVYPVRGYTLTSSFGTRWGRTHTGIDMAASHGTSVYATDGGEVVSAGWEGAKGYCVRINHGGNITSVYAHLSSMLVSRGDKVYQGQKIGLMGSTGRSTGSHLHFEILVNGVPKNPFNYL